MNNVFNAESKASYDEQVDHLLPYKSFKEAQQQLHDLVPIDYFLAKELVVLFTLNNKEEVTLLFHLIIAISIAIREGNSCMPLVHVANSRIGFYADENGIVEYHGYAFPPIDHVNALTSKILITPADNQPLVLVENALYLRRYYCFEQELNAFIASTPDNVPLFSATEIQQCIADLFISQTTDDIDWQKIAVANALNKRFSIIAGGPGTGKTYTVTKLLAAIVKLNHQCPLKIALVAPTGKAAQRLTESLSKAIEGFENEISADVLQQIPQQAQTLHRLLGVIPHKVNFRHHQDNRLSIDVLVVDEVSMVDLPMMARLIRALPAHCQLILLGDADQLPSVAVGNVLADLAPRPHKGYSKENKRYLTSVTKTQGFQLHKSNAFDHVTFLMKSRRFDNEGQVGKLAEFVISGNAAKSWELISKSNSAILLGLDVSQWLPQLVKKHYQGLAQSKHLTEAFNLLAQFRILCATRVGAEGVESINQQVEQLLYTLGNKQAKKPFYHGKPIMITQNDYGLGLFNGDIGLIWTDQNGMLIAVFEQANGEYLHVLPSRLPSFETVYAMTIHKTQGSEFQSLAMVLPQNKDNKLLSRELLYTGITRAKLSLQIACSQSTWFQSVETKVQRYSGITLTKDDK